MGWQGQIQDALTRNWQSVREAVLMPEAAFPADAKVADLASQTAPVIWLLGKVQSGKTSIVHAITQATAAEIGGGYKTCTKATSLFSFPTNAPIIPLLHSHTHTAT